MMVPTPITASLLSKETNSKLSGPVSAYSGYLDGVWYYLFGDEHFSLKGECSLPCKTVDSELNNIDPPGSDNCWDIIRLLTAILSDPDNIFDIFMEVPFSPSRELYGGRIKINKYGEIQKIYQYFQPCFEKDQVNCHWKNARFHYVDIRRIGNAKNIGFTSFIKDWLESAYYGLIWKNTGVLHEKINKDSFTSPTFKWEEFIEDIDKLINWFYVNDINHTLFRIYLLSDNFIGDVSKLFETIPIKKSNIDILNILINEILEQKLIVNRRGKIMHRIRAQLEALEYEGKEELSDKIKKFIFYIYKHTTNNTEILVMLKNIINMDTNKILDEKYLEYLIKLIRNMDVLLMDSYLLARMFRSFDDKHIPSNVRIIYAGAHHIRTYMLFFERMLGVKFEKYGKAINKNPPETKRCIDIDISKFL